MRESARMQFDAWGSASRRRADLFFERIDKKTYANARFREPPDNIPHPFDQGSGIQSSFRGDFLAVFRDQANFGRREFFGISAHPRSYGHFKIQSLQANLARKSLYIYILDMAPIFAQMNRN
jgi:hypothetical protein